MKVKKCCKTCTFYYKGICANNKYMSEIGFNNRTTDTAFIHYCWSISMSTLVSLINSLTRLERRLIIKASHLSANDLMYRVENGYWLPREMLFYSINNYLLKRNGFNKIKIFSGKG